MVAWKYCAQGIDIELDKTVISVVSFSGRSTTSSTSMFGYLNFQCDWECTSDDPSGCRSFGYRPTGPELP